MKINKLMAALIVVSIMMTSVVFGATTATTTTYDVVNSTFDVETVVTGANEAEKITYVLYNGATPEEGNILYIDQKDGSSTATFSVSDIAAANFIGSAILANDDMSETAAAEAVGDLKEVTLGTSDNIESIKVEWDNGASYYYIDTTKTIYVPVNKDVTVTVFPVAGYTLSSADINGVGNVTGNKFKFNDALAGDVTMNLVVAAATEGSSFISVDDEYITEEGVTFIVSTSNVADIYKIGLNVELTGGALNGVKLENMRPAAETTGNAFGIMITDTDGKGLNEVTDFATSISYDDQALTAVNGYYVVQ